jgi:hypothetical protein
VQAWRRDHDGEPVPDGLILTQAWPAGHTDRHRDEVIYYQCRADRARRTLRGIDEQITKAERAVAGKVPVERNRFIRVVGADKSVNRTLEAKARALAERVPIRVDFGGDPLRILGGGTDGFGASGGVGVGVSVEGGDELGHLLVALDAAEGSLRVEHAGGSPAQHHVSVAPAGDVAVGGAGDGDHRLDWVRGGQRLGQAAVDAEAGDGEHLVQPFEQAGRGAGVVLGEQPGKVLGAT